MSGKGADSGARLKNGKASTEATSVHAVQPWLLSHVEEIDDVNQTKIPVSCETCAQKFTEVKDMILHFSTHWDISGSSCQKMNTMKSDLTVQCVDGGFVCHSCGVPATIMFVFREHLRCHIVPVPYECEICNLKIANLSDLRDHLVTAHFERKRTSAFTVKTTPYLKAILDQILEMKKKPEGPQTLIIRVPAAAQSQTSAETSAFSTCQQPARPLPPPASASATLQQPARQLPPLASSTPQQPARLLAPATPIATVTPTRQSTLPQQLLRCDFEGLCFRHFSEYLQHLNVHRKDFYVKADKWQNKTTFAYEDKVYSCSGCPFNVESRCLFFEHVRCHTMNKPYFCNLCNEPAGNNKEMVNHIKTHGNCSRPPQGLFRVNDSPTLNDVMAKLGPAAPSTHGEHKCETRLKPERKRLTGPGADSQNPIDLDEDDDVLFVEMTNKPDGDVRMVTDQPNNRPSTISTLTSQPNLTTMQPMLTSQPNWTTMQPFLTSSQTNLTTMQPTLTSSQPNWTRYQQNWTLVQPNVVPVHPNSTPMQRNSTPVQPNFASSHRNSTPTQTNSTTPFSWTIPQGSDLPGSTMTPPVANQSSIPVVPVAPRPFTPSSYIPIAPRPNGPRAIAPRPIAPRTIGPRPIVITPEKDTVEHQGQRASFQPSQRFSIAALKAITQSHNLSASTTSTASIPVHHADNRIQQASSVARDQQRNLTAPLPLAQLAKQCQQTYQYNQTVTQNAPSTATHNEQTHGNNAPVKNDAPTGTLNSTPSQVSKPSISQPIPSQATQEVTGRNTTELKDSTSAGSGMEKSAVSQVSAASQAVSQVPEVDVLDKNKTKADHAMETEMNTASESAKATKRKSIETDPASQSVKTKKRKPMGTDTDTDTDTDTSESVKTLNSQSMSMPLKPTAATAKVSGDENSPHTQDNLKMQGASATSSTPADPSAALKDSDVSSVESDVDMATSSIEDLSKPSGTGNKMEEAVEKKHLPRAAAQATLAKEQGSKETSEGAGSKQQNQNQTSAANKRSKKGDEDRGDKEKEKDKEGKDKGEGKGKKDKEDEDKDKDKEKEKEKDKDKGDKDKEDDETDQEEHVELEKIIKSFELDYEDGLFICRRCNDTACNRSFKKIAPLRNHLFDKLHPESKKHPKKRQCNHCDPGSYNVKMDCSIVKSAIQHLQRKEAGKLTTVGEKTYVGYVRHVDRLPANTLTMLDHVNSEQQNNGNQVGMDDEEDIDAGNDQEDQHAVNEDTTSDVPMPSDHQQEQSEMDVEDQDDSTQVCQRLIPYDMSLWKKDRIHADVSTEKREKKADDFYQCSIPECMFSSDNRIDIILHTSIKHSKETSFICQYCLEEFSDVHSLLEHVPVHKGIYICNVDDCEFGTKKATDLQKHCKDKHPAQLEYQCFHCKAVFTNGFQWYFDHLNQFRVVKYGCLYCDGVYAAKSGLSEHLNKDHPDAPKRVKMVIEISCGQLAKQQEPPEANPEQQTDAEPEQPTPGPEPDAPQPPPEPEKTPPPATTPPTQEVKCVLCGDRFSEKSDLGDHLKACRLKKGAQRRIQEALLAQQFPQVPMEKPKESTTVSLNSVSTVSFQTPTMENSQGSLERTQPSAASTASASSEASTESPTPTEQKSQTSKRKSTARKSTGGGFSARRSPPKLQAPPPPTIERIVCEHCDYVCYTAIHATRHAAVHSNPGASGEGSAGSGSKPLEVPQHADDDLGKFECKRCPYWSYRRSELRSHLLRGHPGRHVLRTYQCPHCEFESMIETTTEDHVDRRHHEEKCVYEVNREVIEHVGSAPECLICAEDFGLSCLLKLHIVEQHGSEGLLKHTSVALEDDYEFPECLEKTETPKQQGHIAKTAQIVPSEPPIGHIAKYHCDFCEFDTNDFPLFDKHMMTQHGDEVAREHRELHPRPPTPDASSAVPVSPPPTPTGSEGDVESRVHKCDVCPYATSSTKSLWEHNKNHAKFQNQSGWKCGYCVFMSENLNPIYKHQELFHPSQAANVCFLERCDDGDRISNRIVNGLAVSSDEEEEEAMEESNMNTSAGTKRHRASSNSDDGGKRRKIREGSSSSTAEGTPLNVVGLNRFKASLPDMDIFLTPRQCPCCKYCSKLRTNLMNHVYRHLWASAQSNDACHDIHTPAMLAEDEYYDSFDDASDDDDDDSSADLCTRVVVDGKQSYQCNSCDYTRQLRSTVSRHHKHEHHDGHGKYRCPFCDVTKQSGRGLVSHCRSEHPTCPLVLLFGLENTNVLIPGKTIEIEIHGQDTDSSWTDQFVQCNELKKSCSICGHTRSTRGGVRMHIFTSHFRFYPYQCAYCSSRGLDIMKLKNHVETEHNDKPFKLVRFCGLSYEKAPQHRHTQDITAIIDPQPDVDKVSLPIEKILPGVGEVLTKIFEKESTPPSMSSSFIKPEQPRSPGDYISTASGGNISDAHSSSSGGRGTPKHKGRNAPYICRYCDYTTKWNIRDIQKHIFIVHQRKKIATCKLCDYGYNGHSPDDKMAIHFATDHPGLPLNWEDHTKEMSNKIVPVEEKADGCFVVAATGEKGEVLTLADVPKPKRVPVFTSTTNGNQRSRMSTDSSTDYQSEANEMPNYPIDISQVVVRGRYLAKVRDMTKLGKKLYGCSDCNEIFDRKDKVIYHLQAKFQVKPFRCPICHELFNTNSLARIHCKEKHGCDEDILVNQDEVDSLQANVFSFSSQHLPRRVPIIDGGFWTVGKAKAVIKSPPPPPPSGGGVFAPILQSVLASNLTDTRQPAISISSPPNFRTFPKQGETVDPLPEDIRDDPRAIVDRWPPIHQVGGGQWECNYCTFQAPKKNMTGHITRHTTFRPYRCKYCSFKVMTKTKMRLHIANKHQEYIDEDIVPLTRPNQYYLNSAAMEKLYGLGDYGPETNNSSIRQRNSSGASPRRSTTTHNYRITNMQYGEPPSFDRRAIYEEIPEPIRIPGELKQFRCNFCEFIRGSVMMVRKHQETHFSWRPLSCPNCPFQAFNPQHMGDHLDVKHNNVPPKPINVPRPNVHYLNRATCIRLGIMGPHDPPQSQSMPSAASSAAGSPQAAEGSAESGSPIINVVDDGSSSNPGTPSKHNTSSFVSGLGVTKKAGYDTDFCDPRAAVTEIPKPFQVLGGFKCNYCPYSRATCHNVAYHQKNHYTFRPVGCRHCNYRTMHASQMVEHYSSQHKYLTPTDPITYPPPDVYYLNRATCSALGLIGSEEPGMKVYSNEKTLARGQLDGDEDPQFAIKGIPMPRKLREGVFKCNFCDKVMPKTNVNMHQKYHFTYRRYNCKVCSFRAMLLPKLKNHMMTKHPDNKDAYQILPEPPVYYFTYASRNLLGDKIQDFVGALKPQCSRCTERFSGEMELNGHLATHHPECVQFECSYCKRKLFTKNDLSAHHIELHGHYLPDYNVVPLPDLDKRGQLCEICKVGIPLSFPMHIHLADRHADAVVVICSHCKQESPDKGQLRLHHTDNHPGEPLVYDVRIKPSFKKTPAVECPVCQEEMQSDWKVDLHLADKHPEHVLYMCEHCGGLLSTKKQWLSHSQEKHPEKSPDYRIIRNIKQSFMDPKLCQPKTEPNEENMETEDNINDEDVDVDMKEEECDHCNAVSGSELRTHIMEHHFEYLPYLCLYCPFKCTSIFDIKEHHYANHANENLKVNQRLDTSMEAQVAKKVKEIESARINKNQLQHSSRLGTLAQAPMSLGGGLTQAKMSLGSQNQSSTGGGLARSHLSSSAKVPFSSSKITSTIEQTEYGFTCSDCDYVGDTRKKVYNHAWYKHRNPNAGPPRSSGDESNSPRKGGSKAKWQCGYCKEFFYARFSLINHSDKVHPGLAPSMTRVRGHTRPAQIPQSSNGRSTDVGNPLITDNVSAAVSSLQRPGPKCSKSDNQSVESGIWHLNCHLCNFSCYEQRDLFLHVDHHHSAQGTKLKCQFCPFTTETASEYDDHRMVHTLVRPFKCGYCDYAQFNQHLVRRHHHSNHPDQELNIINNENPSISTLNAYKDKESKIVLKDPLHMSQLELEMLLEENGAAEFNCSFLMDDGFKYRIDINLNKEEDEVEENEDPEDGQDV